MEIVNLEQYVDLERPEVEWLVEGLIPRPGFTVLSGPPKAGKSYLSLQLALAVAHGQEFLGHKCKKGAVLYLQFDTSEMVWRDRLRHLREKGVAIGGDVYMIDPAFQPTWVNIQRPDTQHVLTAAIEKCQPDLIVIDVLREIHSADENDSSEMKVVGDLLRALCHGRSTLLDHHSRKMGALDERDPVQAHRGSSYITGMADSVWLLDHETLYIRSRFSGHKQYSLHQGSSGFFTLAHPHRTLPVAPAIETPPAPADPIEYAGSTPPPVLFPLGSFPRRGNG